MNSVLLPQALYQIGEIVLKCLFERHYTAANIFGEEDFKANDFFPKSVC